MLSENSGNSIDAQLLHEALRYYMGGLGNLTAHLRPEFYCAAVQPTVLRMPMGI